jgi:hypothetical protein
MKLIEKEFSKYGEKFVQLDRVGDVAIYSRESSGYEVILVQRCSSDREIGGRVVSQVGDEYYPSTESFGRLAWAFMTIECAMAKFRDVVKAQEIKVKKK